MRGWLLRLTCRLTDHFRYRASSYVHLEWRGESHHERMHGWEIVDIVKCTRCGWMLYLPRPEKRTVWHPKPASWLLPRKEWDRAAWATWMDGQWWRQLLWAVKRAGYETLMALRLYRVNEEGGYYHDGRLTWPWVGR